MESRNYFLLCLLFIFKSDFVDSEAHFNCGKDESLADTVYEGGSTIDTFPWLGTLIYSTPTEFYTASVVLVARIIAIASSAEIQKIPKHDFRERSRIVMGGNCLKGPLLSIVEYSYHPEFKADKPNEHTLTIIQLKANNQTRALHPICRPPRDFTNAELYVVTRPLDCRKTEVQLFKVDYVEKEECRRFYNSSTYKQWPERSACAKSLWGGTCVWPTGSVMMARLNGRWRLTGFGIFGPGCELPSRFLDYGMYQGWIDENIARMGSPSITKVATDEVVLRKRVSSVQRFGPCDAEETREEIYSDQTEIIPPELEDPSYGTAFRRAVYNLTVYDNVDYSCLVLRVWQKDKPFRMKPKIDITRYCAVHRVVCYEPRFTQIDFFVEIIFTGRVIYKVHAYGQPHKTLNTLKFMGKLNRMREYRKVYTSTAAKTPETPTKTTHVTTPKWLNPTRKTAPKAAPAPAPAPAPAAG